MASATEELLAVPDTRAARLAKVSRDRLKYWDENNLVSPSIKRQISPRNTVRLYNFQDLLSLLVVSELRTERDMSLQHIRRVVKHLQSRGYAAPLRELKFATVGRHIYFQHPDGTWEGDIQPDQIILEKTIHLDPLRARIDNATKRKSKDAGRVVRRRGVQGSKPIFAGTRIPVATVQRYLSAGYEPEAIIEEYPSLTRADIEKARRLAEAS
jgi:uncharacterized protein (DUF433 family)